MAAGGLVVIMSYKFCAKCLQEKQTDGGVQTSASRWLCAKCWTHFTQKKTKA